MASKLERNVTADDKHRGNAFRKTATVVGLLLLASIGVSAFVAAAVAAMLVTHGSSSISRPLSLNPDVSKDRHLLAERSVQDSSRLQASAASGQFLDTRTMDDSHPVCVDAVEGEVCHRLVVWAMEDGLRLQPGSFAGLTQTSPFHAFQHAMHKRSPELCPMPCMREAALAAHPATLVTSSVFRHSSYRSCDYGHVDSLPAHAGCFVVWEGQLLVTRIPYEGEWYDIPGRQTDWHEPARCTAHREVLEATGYVAAPRDLLAVVRNDFHIYRCELSQRHPIRHQDREVRWMTLDEIRDGVRRQLFRFPEAARYADWLRRSN